MNFQGDQPGLAAFREGADGLDRAAILAGHGVSNAQGLAAAPLKEVHGDRVHARIELDLAVPPPAGVQAVVVHDQLISDVEPAAVIGGGDECVLTLLLDLDEAGEPETELVVPLPWTISTSDIFLDALAAELTSVVTSSSRYFLFAFIPFG